MTISVIIPVYNAERFLKKAVESALQFESVREVILVEDGSPDNALALCCQLEQEYNRVKVHRHPNGENRGAGASRNLGLKKAKQAYIAFLDADDFYLPNRFDMDKQVFAQHADADGCYNAIGVHYNSKKAQKEFDKTFGKIKLTTVRENLAPIELFPKLIGMHKNIGYFHLDGLTLKKRALAKIDGWFNEDLRLHQDTDFIFRAAYYNNLYPSSITQPVSLRGVHEVNRITATRNNKDQTKKNQILLWNSLFRWAIKENIEQSYQKFFATSAATWQLLHKPSIRSFFSFHWLIIKFPDLWRKHKFYNLLHPHIFGTNLFAATLLKIKHKMQQLLRISGYYN